MFKEVNPWSKQKKPSTFYHNSFIKQSPQQKTPHPIHPGKLTWNPKKGVLVQMIFLFNWVIFRFLSPLIFQGVNTPSQNPNGAAVTELSELSSNLNLDLEAIGNHDTRRPRCDRIRLEDSVNKKIPSGLLYLLQWVELKKKVLGDFKWNFKGEEWMMKFFGNKNTVLVEGRIPHT